VNRIKVDEYSLSSMSHMPGQTLSSLPVLQWLQPFLSIFCHFMIPLFARHGNQSFNVSVFQGQDRTHDQVKFREGAKS
jgi:hypothetical protein